jgi:DNA polymerase-3 subunit epsilon
MSLVPIYYDTETTGLSPEKNRLVEIAFFNAVTERSFVSLINPKVPIPPEASAISGITDQMVADAPTFGELIPELLEFCEGQTVLIAHNNDAFDQPFLAAEFQRALHPMPQWNFIDSLKWARKYRPDLPRHSLQFLRGLFNIAENRAHRALDDVIVLKQVFELLTGNLSLETVLQLLQRQGSARNIASSGTPAPGQLHIMPFGKHQGKHLKDVPKNYIKWMQTSLLLDKTENTQLRAQLLELGLL